MAENIAPTKKVQLLVRNEDGSVRKALFHSPSSLNGNGGTSVFLLPLREPTRTGGPSALPGLTLARTPTATLSVADPVQDSAVIERSSIVDASPLRVLPTTPGRVTDMSTPSGATAISVFKRPSVYKKSAQGVFVKTEPVGCGASDFLTTPTRPGALREAHVEIARLNAIINSSKAEIAQLKYGHSIDMATKDQHIDKLKSKLEEARNNVQLTRKRELRAKAKVEDLRDVAASSEQDQTPCLRKSYDCLLDARIRKARFSSLKEVVLKLCVSDDPSVISVFLSDFADFMNGPGVEASLSKFTAYQSLIFKQKFDISYTKYRNIKRMLREVCGFKVLASVRQLQKQADKHSMKSMYTVSSVTDADAKPVPVIELNNLRGRLELRLQALSDSGKLLRGDEFEDKIWLCVIADKGGSDTKLGVMIANVESTNSYHNITLCGAYHGEDKQANILKCLPNVVDEINNLKLLSYRLDGQVITVEIRWFLTGDFAFLYSCFGHKGASATHDCLFCTDRKCRDISTWNPNSSSVSRTIESYSADSVTGANGVYLNSSVLFPNIPVENVVRPSLHMFMGLGDFAFEALEAAASQVDSNSVIVSGSLVTTRAQKAQLAGLRKDLKSELCTMQTFKDDLKRSELVHTVLLAIENRVIEPPKTKSGTSQERLCMAGANCVMRDRRAYDIDRRMWDVCTLCKGDFHFECVGQISAETGLRMTLKGCVCFDCENVSLKQRIEYVKTEVEDLRKCLVESGVKHNKLQDDVNILNSALNDGTGAKTRELDRKYRECGGDRSAFHQKFTGNHTLKLLREGNAAALWSIFPDSHEKDHFIKYMEILGELQGFAHSGFLTPSEIDRMREIIPEMLYHLKEANPKLSVTPKLHCMIKHVVEFVERTGTWGKMSEQAIESLHAYMNRMNARFAGVRNQMSRYHSMSDAMAFGNHLFDIGQK